MFNMFPILAKQVSMLIFSSKYTAQQKGDVNVINHTTKYITKLKC